MESIEREKIGTPAGVLCWIKKDPVDEIYRKTKKN
jgi:hypothetical protein